MKSCVFKAKELFPIYPVTIGKSHSQENVERPSGMNINQIFVVRDGEGFVCADNIKTKVKTGDMFFLKKNIPHIYCGNERFKTAFLAFKGDLCENIFTYFGIGGSGVYKDKNYESVILKLEDFYDDFENINDYAALSARTYSTVIEFFREVLKSENTPIENVKKYIDSNFGKPLSLMDIMEFYPYSKAKLCRDFSAQYGMSIFNMLTKIRLDHAKIMLKSDPCIKLGEVAKSCGFNDTSYFCKVYRSAFGTTPKSNCI